MLIPVKTTQGNCAIDGNKGNMGDEYIGNVFNKGNIYNLGKIANKN